MYTCCVFDLDGTLVNSLFDLAASTNHALRAQGLPERKIEEYRYIVGRGALNMVKGALPPELSEKTETAEKTLALFREYYALHYLDKTAPYPGIPEALEALAKQGVRCSVNSNKPHDFVQLIVKKLFGEDIFTSVIGQRPGFGIKPDPAGALEACGKMGAKPENCVYIGDSNVDMKTGFAAGMLPVGALWGFRTKAELLEAGAVKTLIGPEEIPALFSADFN